MLKQQSVRRNIGNRKWNIKLKSWIIDQWKQEINRKARKSTKDSKKSTEKRSTIDPQTETRPPKSAKIPYNSNDLPDIDRECHLFRSNPRTNRLNTLYPHLSVLTKFTIPFNLKSECFKTIFGGESINKGAIGELTKTNDEKAEFHFRKPKKSDGGAVWELIKHTGVLDLNSSYSYLMWCEIFSETSVVAERDGELVGFISGFMHPGHPTTLFIWQVAVDSSQRGQGLGTKMLFDLLNRESSHDIEMVQATVSPSNLPSRKLFKGLAEKLDTECEIDAYFTEDDFPREGHEEELLFKIGPIQEQNIMIKG